MQISAAYNNCLFFVTSPPLPCFCHTIIPFIFVTSLSPYSEAWMNVSLHTIATGILYNSVGDGFWGSGSFSPLPTTHFSLPSSHTTASVEGNRGKHTHVSADTLPHVPVIEKHDVYVQFMGMDSGWDMLQHKRTRKEKSARKLHKNGIQCFFPKLGSVAFSNFSGWKIHIQLPPGFWVTADAFGARALFQMVLFGEFEEFHATLK